MPWGRNALRALCADAGLEPKVITPAAPRKRGWRTGVSRREHDKLRLSAHAELMREQYGSMTMAEYDRERDVRMVERVIENERERRKTLSSARR